MVRETIATERDRVAVAGLVLGGLARDEPLDDVVREFYLGLNVEGFNLGWVAHYRSSDGRAYVQLVTRDARPLACISEGVRRHLRNDVELDAVHERVVVDRPRVRRRRRARRQGHGVVVDAGRLLLALGARNAAAIAEGRRSRELSRRRGMLRPQRFRRCRRRPLPFLRGIPRDAVRVAVAPSVPDDLAAVVDVDLWQEARLIVRRPARLPAALIEGNYCATHGTHIYPDLPCPVYRERPVSAATGMPRRRPVA